MATKKAKTKTKAKKTSKSAERISLPNGFRVIGRAPAWDVEKNPVIEGPRGKAHEVTMDEGTKNERTVRNFVLTDEEIGAVTVWESGSLRSLFDETDDGDVVRLEYLGLGEAKKKGHNPPKLFACAVKDE
jgi:ssDNA-binding replication factor A large subunit